MFGAPTCSATVVGSPSPVVLRWRCGGGDSVSLAFSGSSRLTLRRCTAGVCCAGSCGARAPVGVDGLFGVSGDSHQARPLTAGSSAAPLWSAGQPCAPPGGGADDPAAGGDGVQLVVDVDDERPDELATPAVVLERSAHPCHRVPAPGSRRSGSVWHSPPRSRPGGTARLHDRHGQQLVTLVEPHSEDARGGPPHRAKRLVVGARTGSTGLAARPAADRPRRRTAPRRPARRHHAG